MVVMVVIVVVVVGVVVAGSMCNSSVPCLPPPARSSQFLLWAFSWLINSFPTAKKHTLVPSSFPPYENIVGKSKWINLGTSDQ